APATNAWSAARRISVFRTRSERKLISIRIDHVEIAHAIVVVLRRLEDRCSSHHQLGMDRIYIPDEDADGAIAREPTGSARTQQMQGNFVPAKAHIKGRSAVFERDREAERLAVVLGALGYVGNDEYGSGANHHWVYRHRRLRIWLRAANT